MICNKMLGVSAGTALLFAVDAQAAPFMYVPTGVSNEIVAVDLDGDRIVNRITEVENAHGLAARWPCVMKSNWVRASGIRWSSWRSDGPPQFGCWSRR